jgi:sporulation protein YlmC with PRC-barrel domain
MPLHALSVLARILHKDLCSTQKEGSSSLVGRRHAVMVKKVTSDCTGGSLISREEQKVMAQIEKTAKMIRLSDTELTITNPAEDIRGRAVVDRDGEDLGEVEDLLIDEPEKRVRLLEVASGGFLGLGKTKFLLPVEAITRISDDTVYVNQTRQYIAGAPHYDPDLIHQEAGAKGYYGERGYYNDV